MDLKKLKKIIQDANPEIMELKFGSEIDIAWADGVPEERIKFSERYMTDNGDGTVVEDNCLGMISTNYGRPIRIADVLLAMKVMEDRCFTDQIDLIRGDIETCNWNLKDDNLDHQSEETKQFLIDLLVK